MHIRIGLFPSMLIGYLLGCFFTPYMSINLQMTEWYNIFVYAWIFFWPAALIFHFIGWFLMSGAWLVCLLLAFLIIVILSASGV